VEQLGYLRAAVAPISNIQQQLRANDAAPLAVNDRIAHQYQIAGGEVLFRIEAQLPKSLLGVGLFQADREFTGSAQLFYYSTIAQMRIPTRTQVRQCKRVSFPGIFIKRALRQPNSAVRVRRAEKNTRRQRP
jgi:hypothetical protein